VLFSIYIFNIFIFYDLFLSAVWVYHVHLVGLDVVVANRVECRLHLDLCDLKDLVTSRTYLLWINHYHIFAYHLCIHSCVSTQASLSFCPLETGRLQFLNNKSVRFGINSCTLFRHHTELGFAVFDILRDAATYRLLQRTHVLLN
jgi:hypothetical protein